MVITAHSDARQLHSSRATRARRRGVTLLLSLFVIAVTSVLLVGILDAQASRAAALRNTIDYERALYLAGAGAHAALAELEQDSDWMKGIAATEFPAGSGNTYAATIGFGSGGSLVITGIGTSGEVTRRLEVTIDTGS